MSSRLFLLDAYALIYRAYYALLRAPRMTSTGLNTSAVFGFCNTLDDVLRKENPTHMAVCFDPVGGNTFRHQLYPDYKAGRDKQPEDISLAIPYIKRILEAMHIPVVEVEGYEADDVIGTLATRAAAEGIDTYMMTFDKDYGQLVGPRIWMYRPALRGEGFEVRGPKEVCERFGISRTSQIIDLLALEGDSSDNVPGCPGVGEKTAQKLIAEWGSVEEVIANIPNLKGATKKRIEDNREKIMFSKMLVTIKTDVPLPDSLTFASLERKPEDVDKLAEVYRELEFKSFIKKLQERLPASGGAPSPALPDGTQQSLFGDDDAGALPVTLMECPRGAYAPAPTVQAVGRLVEKAVASGMAGIALHSVGDEAMTATLYGLAISTGPCEARYIALPPTPAERREVMAVLEPLVGSAQTVIVSHDAKRDLLLLRREGLDVTAPLFDTSLAHYLLNSEGRHDLPSVMARHLQLESTLLPEPKKWHARPALAPIDLMNRFCEEADVVRRLQPVLLDEIEKAGMRSLLYDVELPLVRVLAEMEWTGVRINVDELVALRKEYNERLRRMEEEAFAVAGERFNTGSPSQVGELLFGKLALDPKAKRTSTGAYSTTEAILEKHRDDHPLVGLILDIRKLKKVISTYLDALPGLVNPATGKIHTTFNQTVSTTGRISSTNPNLQNIPVRTADGREIRRAFVADPGCLILSADYSQIELRLLANMSADSNLIDAFLSGDDVHAATAAKIYHKDSAADVTPAERRNAKTANFGIVYGISAFGLSQRLGISRAEAKELIDGYFQNYPHIRDYLDSAVALAREKGYAETIMHRRHPLPDIGSRNAVVRGLAERNAVNSPLQGSAADIIKVAMIGVYDDMQARGMKSRMVMQVHDELIFNVVPDELEALKEIVVSRMEGAWRSMVPLEVNVGVGTNWLDAK